MSQTLARATALGVACVALFFPVAPSLRAHGDVHEQIEALTRRLKAEPRNAELWLKRGELRRVHGDTELALADYRTAAKLDPALDAVELCTARALLEGKRAAEAQAPLDRLLARRPGEPEALLLYARVDAALGRRAEAADLYPRALAAAPRAEPDLFIETARALAAASRCDEALATLDGGVARLGAAPALELAAVDVEISLGRTDAAVARLDRLAATSPRKESWLARKAEILESSGRADDARASFAEALRALEVLPPRIRATRAVAALESSVRAGLARVSKS